MQKIEVEYSLSAAVQLDASGGEPLHVTVSELAQSVRRQLEVSFDSVRVRGEISGFRGPHASGHVYFGLKEGSVRLDAVIWGRAYAQMPFKPEEGLEVFASGRISTFPQKSSYQLVVTSLEPAGAGALMALLEERRRMLAAEGLFDASRKRALPFLPRTIAAITSPSGSVVHDMIHRISARFPRRLLVWPVRVQGDGAAAEIVNALTRLNALSTDGSIPRPDIIIIARGGGSLQDLWSFNDEALVRAVAASAIPVISAIGHQTDWTLADYAADVRAPTPTAAAELCVPVLADVVARGQSLAARLLGAVGQLHTNWKRQAYQTYMGVKNQRVLLLTSFQRLSMAASLLERNTLVRDCRARFAEAALTLTRDLNARREAIPAQRAHAASLFARLDLRRRQIADERATSGARQAAELVRVFRGNVEQRGQQFAALDRTLHLRRATLLHVVATRRQALVHGYAGLAAKCRDLLSAFRSDLSERGKIRAAVSYTGVLERGFALVRGPSGKTLHRADEARGERALTLEFADGQIAVSVGAARRKKSVATVEQKALF